MDTTEMSISYGQDRMSARLSTANLIGVFEPRPPCVPDDQAAEVAHTLDNPAGSPKGAPDIDITILVATGFHRGTTPTDTLSKKSGLPNLPANRFFCGASEAGHSARRPLFILQSSLNTAAEIPSMASSV